MNKIIVSGCLHSEKKKNTENKASTSNTENCTLNDSYRVGRAGVGWERERGKLLLQHEIVALT